LVEIGKEMIDDPKSAFKNFSDRYPRYWAWKWWWSYDEELFLKHAWQIGLESTRLAKSQRCFAPALKQFQQASDQLVKMYPHVEDRSIFGVYGSTDLVYRFLRKVAFAETQKEMLVTAIALNRYRLRHGKFPTEVSALTSEFLPELPRDWIDGQPLRYRSKENGQFVLYSIGEDGVDDDGDPTPKEKTARSNIFEGRDWVWPMPATAEEVAADNVSMAKQRPRMMKPSNMSEMLRRYGIGLTTNQPTTTGAK
jgi:hypothetical protein